MGVSATTTYTDEDFQWEAVDNLPFFYGTGYKEALLNGIGTSSSTGTSSAGGSSSTVDASVKAWIEEIKENVEAIVGKIDGRGINFIGIAASDPTQGQFKLKGETEYVVPRKNDLVVYGTKEYLYRKSDDGETYGWFELGDEDAPVWS